MTVFAPLLGTLWRTIESYGIDPRRVIRESVYQPESSFGLSERVPRNTYNQILADAFKLIDDPLIGLKSAQYLHPSHLGALGHAWLASSSLETAIKRAQRFSKMYDEQVRMLVQEEPGILSVAYETNNSALLPDIIADANLASLLNLCRLNFGNSLIPVYVHMCRNKPADPKPWHDCFGVEVQFDQAENSLAISYQDATKQLTGSSPMMVALHEDIIKRQIAELDRSDIINRALVVIMDQLPSGAVSETSVARSLNMTKRTLHRKLVENGLSFRSLLTNVRKELVQRYIKEPAYSITEISFLLGYNDTSAFSRAFKRWHGLSPTQARGGGQPT